MKISEYFDRFTEYMMELESGTPLKSMYPKLQELHAEALEAKLPIGPLLSEADLSSSIQLVYPEDLDGDEDSYDEEEYSYDEEGSMIC